MFVYTIHRQRAEAMRVTRLPCGLWRTDYADRPAELTHRPPPRARQPRANAALAGRVLAAPASRAPVG